MSEFNCDVVITTLQQVLKILDDKHIEYRFFGSVVVAAMNGELHRKLDDLDLIIDSKGKKYLYAHLTQLGYKRAGGVFTFARKYLCEETLEHSSLLGVGYFLSAGNQQSAPYNYQLRFLEGRLSHNK